jgi:Tol biopolymer transport system component
MGRWRVRHCAAVVVSLFALLASTASAEAQYFGRNKVHYDRFDFRVLRTEHFDIYYYSEEEQATRLAGRMAERWYARLSRVLDHRFTHRQPIVLYASHPHFAQTNVTAESPGEGTGGLTERNKSRIALPFTAGLGETDHVLGHEIAHAFQIDIAKKSRQNAFSLPGWFIEGMAEYLSLGPVNVHTSMWLRDAALFDRLPTLDQLDDPRYFPYRYGHAFWSYLTGRFGEGIVSQMLRSRTRGAIKRLTEATSLSAEELQRDWHESVSTDGTERPRGISRPHLVLSARNDTARMHLAPALSPDGTQLVFMSERDRLSLDLFLADASTGAVSKKLLSTATDPHLDSLQYIQSSGAWDSTGRRFALTAVTESEPVLLTIDMARGGRPTEVKLPGIGEAYNPSWSPDGTRIVFSGLKGGLSDLFIYTVSTGAIERLTADGFADLQPSWSPDGRTIALSTDRFTSSLQTLTFGPLRVGLLDVASGVIRPAAADSSSAKQLSPQWSPDGRAIYFVSDRTSISNVYRIDLSSGDLRQVTAVSGGVTGITATSPALAVASGAGTLAFSVYRNGRYEIQTLNAARASAGLPVDTSMSAGTSDAFEAEGTLSNLLADPLFGLPSDGNFDVRPYDDRLRVEALAQPYIGAATTGDFGGVLRGSFGVVFGDTLRNRQLQTMVRAGTARDDFAAQVAYSNRIGQWNWGVVGGFAPSRFVGARRALFRGDTSVTREMTHLRYENEWAGLTSRYNINRARRFEFGVSVRRTGYQWQTQTRVVNSLTRQTTTRLTSETPAGAPVYLAEGEAAFVHDTAIMGPTGPVLGQRLRLEVAPAIGGLAYATVRADVRRYFLPVRPVTVAVRSQYAARYGSGSSDPRLTPLLLGLQTLVRGYDIGSYAADECGRAATSCSLVDELAGSRIGVINLELRAPILGLLTGDLDYGRLPVDAIAFVDAAFLSTRRPGETADRDRFRSIGVGARANLGGMVFEMAAARPFDRIRKGWTVSLLLRPGF